MKTIHYLLFMSLVSLLYACESNNQMQVSETDEQNMVSNKDTSLTIPAEDTTIYYQPDVIASFKGGEEARIQFFKDNMIIPDNLVKGKHDITVFFQFVVEKDGSITRVKKLKGINTACDKEAFRLLQMAKFEAARMNGEKVRSWFTFPVVFYKAI